MTYSLPRLALYAMVAATIAGCSSAQSGSIPAVGPAGSNDVVAIRATRINPAKGTKTVFISDAYADHVYLFSYPKFKYLGAAHQPPEGFSEPQGLCSDRDGDVYVANTANSTIDEYAGDGTFLRSLKDAKKYPLFCAVDPKTNTLAVRNIISTSGGPGGVVLYANASGTPQPFSDPNFSQINSLVYYGETGKLFYTGDLTSGPPALGSYYNGQYKVVTIKGPGFEPGWILYAAKTKSLVVANTSSPYTPGYYFVKQNGKVTGNMSLGCPSGFCDVVQPTIEGGTFIAPDAASVAVAAYKFPAGGTPYAIFKGANFEQPIGSAVGIVK
jgi:hypothetical protein